MAQAVAVFMLDTARPLEHVADSEAHQHCLDVIRGILEEYLIRLAITFGKASAPRILFVFLPPTTDRMTTNVASVISPFNLVRLISELNDGLHMSGAASDDDTVRVFQHAFDLVLPASSRLSPPPPCREVHLLTTRLPHFDERASSWLQVAHI